jgi:hypothetical protein
MTERALSARDVAEMMRAAEDTQRYATARTVALATRYRGALFAQRVIEVSVEVKLCLRVGALSRGALIWRHRRSSAGPPGERLEAIEFPQGKLLPEREHPVLGNPRKVAGVIPATKAEIPANLIFQRVAVVVRKPGGAVLLILRIKLIEESLHDGNGWAVS